MDELTFTDVLTHYQIKLAETSEELEAIKTLIKKSENCILSGWEGASAEACKLKLEVIYNDLIKTLADISEAKNSLTAIGDIFEQEQSLSIECLTEDIK